MPNEGFLVTLVNQGLITRTLHFKGRLYTYGRDLHIKNLSLNTSLQYKAEMQKKKISKPKSLKHLDLACIKARIRAEFLENVCYQA